MTTVPLTHLRRLTDAGGLFEHAEGTRPRREHGYCVDDVARALVVLAREQPGAADDLLEGYLAFVLSAQDPDGTFRNRRSTDLRWHGKAGVEDCWGRALWGLGVAAASPAVPVASQARAREAFRRGVGWRSPHLRATCFAALGAAALQELHPADEAARDLLRDAAAAVGRPADDPVWPWPEPRLRYANAVLPHVLLAAGSALGLPALVADGVLLLDWLLRVQTRGSVLSLVPAQGRARGEGGPGFDQQPIEAAALADACASAWAVTGDRRWAEEVARAAAWFDGANDSGTALHDPHSGGGYDGLEPGGRNANQGAESTLALLSTRQHARACALPAPRPPAP
ncbi:hypothetical protein EV189_0890 [Motilibacter rhizosphaerae]|uniref:Glycosyltransferase n=1 Tax=Motilibacter rhizosphaerae TaxID=598652 RepID=A0A4Q7NWF9_9ACTN|nr:glycosyltransferase [Motilibacter rhizosphaerae]RZS91643.1 hypothetical protein EV189_0890 [Motilibacter rhizosphaerae]